jgi:acylphosphatase
MLVCKRVVYRGRVQGVGFRYTVHRLASALPVAGVVKNLRDGSVELIAEGEPAAVDSLLARVAQQMGGYIVNAEASVQEPQGYRGFRIEY